jgi:hypothetical protein
MEVTLRGYISQKLNPDISSDDWINGGNKKIWLVLDEPTKQKVRRVYAARGIVGRAHVLPIFTTRRSDFSRMVGRWCDWRVKVYRQKSAGGSYWVFRLL